MHELPSSLFPIVVEVVAGHQVEEGDLRDEESHNIE